MLALAALGAALLGRGHVPWLLMAAALAAVLAVRSRAFPRALLWIAGRVRPLRRGQGLLAELLGSAQALLAPDMFLLAFGLGLAGWGMEGLIATMVLRAFGLAFSPAASLLVVASSAIAGGVSALPGGIGAAEGVMVGLLLWLRVPAPLAVLTTLITRLSTLWLGVAVGLACLGLSESRRDRRAGAVPVAAAALPVGPRGYGGGGAA
jgi:uncharacterized membrane protein YbhN (UPF0104 family)